ncbi:MAG: hypothetical protein JNN21_09080 [Candidatus Accumulibacter sp.]|nr:hypothetical protein [Accumulibacter sp.]
MKFAFADDRALIVGVALPLADRLDFDSAARREPFREQKPPGSRQSKRLPALFICVHSLAGAIETETWAPQTPLLGG